MTMRLAVFSVTALIWLYNAITFLPILLNH